MDLNVDEREAVKAASGTVGEYLEAIGKTDLAQMTEAEWHGFIGHAYVSVSAQVQAIYKRDCPF